MIHMKEKFKFIPLMLACLMIISVFAGCGQNEETQSSEASQNATQVPTAQTKATEKETEQTEDENVGDTDNRISFEDFSIILPEKWCYEENVNGVIFYEKEVHTETSYGMLVGIMKCEQPQQAEVSGRAYLGGHSGGYFYSVRPTSPDVDTENEKLLHLWMTANEQVDSILNTIEWANDYAPVENTGNVGNNNSSQSTVNLSSSIAGTWTRSDGDLTFTGGASGTYKFDSTGMYDETGSYSISSDGTLTMKSTQGDTRTMKYASADLIKDGESGWCVEGNTLYLGESYNVYTRK